jgi:hypothetical protein
MAKMILQEEIKMTNSQSIPQVDKSKIWKTGLLAISASVVANLAAYFVLNALLDLPPTAEFPPLGPASIAIVTALFTATGVMVFAIIARVSDNPVRLYWIISTIAVVLVSIPNVIAAMNPAAAPFPFPGGTSTAYLVLIVFHVIAYLITTGTMTTRTLVD